MTTNSRTQQPEPASISICPNCQRPSLSSARRCSYCLADLSETQTVSPDVAAIALAERRRAIASQARQARAARWIRIITGVVGLLLVSYWIYSNYIREPELLPGASSTMVSATLSPDTWPNADGGLGRLRRSESPSRLTGDEAWRIELPAAAETGLVADEQRLYLSLADGSLVAYSVEDGSEVWLRDYEKFLLAAPVLADGTLYVPLQDGNLQALESATGKLFWEVSTGDLLATSPLVADGIVYLLGQSEWFGIDAKTGEQLWSQDIDVGWDKVQRSFQSPVINRDHVVVGASDRVLVLDRWTGELTYWYSTVSFPTRIAMEGGTIFALSPWQSVALDDDSSRPWWDGFRRAWVQFYIWGMAPATPPVPRTWIHSEPPREYFAPAIGTDLLYIMGRRGSLVAHWKHDGSIAWERTVPGATADPLITSDGLLVSTDGWLLLLDPESGEEIASRQIDQQLSSAAVTNHGSYIVGTTTITALH
jgi:outer membrane protein assembly factor BamB